MCYWTCLWSALATTVSRSVSGGFLLLGNAQGQDLPQLYTIGYSKLERKIYKEIEAVTVEELSTAIHNLPARCELVVENDGLHIEQLF